jgi:hypothetical protein
VDRFERLNLIDKLRAESAAGRERIRQRQEARERDPCLEHDHLMAEASEPQRKPLVQKSDTADLVYRVHENDALLPAAAGEPAASEDWSGWDRWLGAHLGIARRDLLDTVSKALGEIIGTERAAMRQERDAEMLKLRAELAELKGRVDTLLGLLTKGDVIDLPRGGWRRDRA